MTEEFISISSKKRRGKRVKKNKKEDAKGPEITNKMRLLFQERCPEASEVRKIHPKIQHVFVPKRPANVRYCVLKFDSAEALEEVRCALHRKRVEPFRGILRCSNTIANTLINIKKSNPQLLSHKYLTKVDIKHAKMVHNKKSGATVDVLSNSTERELFVRYGVLPSIKTKEGQSKKEMLTVQNEIEGSCNESDKSDK